MAASDVQKLTLDDLVENPKKYGLPTFREFMRNPDTLRGAADELFGYIDKGSTTLAHLVREHRYYWQGHRMDSLEAVEKAAMSDTGLTPRDLSIAPELEKSTAGKYIVHVYVTTKKKLVEA